MKRIAYLGPEGTVSEESARYFFQRHENCEFVPYRLISDVLMATKKGETDYSVVPIENTIEGSVSLHLDWLIHKVDLPIYAEWVYPSVQNLIGYPERKQGESLDVKRIYSHPVAIAQCRDFLDQHLPDVAFENVSSTAEGVKIVAAHPGEPWAAIGTKLAAGKFGLTVLQENITDHQNNYTRFLLVGSAPLELNPSSMQKTSIVVTLPEDYPGALHQVLSAFAWRKLNLSRIESRPTKQKLGSYYFVIDIEESMESVLLQSALAEIEALGCQVRLLGSYPSYPYYSEVHN